MFKQSRKQLIWSIVLIVISVLSLVLTNFLDMPTRATIGYLALGVLIQIVVWIVIFGIVGYGLWWLLRKKQPFLLIFAILFFLAAIFEVASQVYILSIEAQMMEALDNGSFEQLLEGLVE